MPPHLKMEIRRDEEEHIDAKHTAQCRKSTLYWGPSVVYDVLIEFKA